MDDFMSSVSQCMHRYRVAIQKPEFYRGEQLSSGYVDLRYPEGRAANGTQYRCDSVLQLIARHGVNALSKLQARQRNTSCLMPISPKVGSRRLPMRLSFGLPQ